MFKPLTEESMKRIAALMIEEMRTPLLDKGIKLTYTDKALTLLVKHAEGGRYGARDLRNTIRRECEDKIAEVLVDTADNPPASIRISVRNDNIDIVPKMKAVPLIQEEVTE